MAHKTSFCTTPPQISNECGSKKRLTNRTCRSFMVPEGESLSGASNSLWDGIACPHFL
jgi:uncharacterized protein YlaI